jgi:hypothetical protein
MDRIQNQDGSCQKALLVRVLTAGTFLVLVMTLAMSESEFHLQGMWIEKFIALVTESSGRYLLGASLAPSIIALLGVDRSSLSQIQVRFDYHALTPTVSLFLIYAFYRSRRTTLIAETSSHRLFGITDANHRFFCGRNRASDIEKPAL